MFAKRFAKKTSLLALSAALTAAMLAAPAQARPDDPENDRGRGAWSRSSQGQAATPHEMRRGPEMRGGNEMRRGGNPDTQRRWSRPAPNIAQPASPAAPRAEWGRRGGGWRERSVATPPAPQVAQQHERRWGERGTPGTVHAVPSPRFEGRNRSYADPERNRTYRDTARERDGGRQDWRRDLDHNERRTEWRRDNDRRDSWRGDNDWRRHDGNRYDRRAYSGQHRRWDNGWRNDRRYDWYSYRNSHRHVYRLGNYHAPYRGYYYRPLSIGFMLDSLFFSSRYWINDPWQYRLPAAYGPYRWVRYYDDALLVDIYSGEVVDVIRDFFW